MKFDESYNLGRMNSSEGFPNVYILIEIAKYNNKSVYAYIKTKNYIPNTRISSLPSLTNSEWRWRYLYPITATLIDFDLLKGEQRKSEYTIPVNYKQPSSNFVLLDIPKIKDTEMDMEKYIADRNSNSKFDYQMQDYKKNVDTTDSFKGEVICIKNSALVKTGALLNSPLNTSLPNNRVIQGEIFFVKEEKSVVDPTDNKTNIRLHIYKYNNGDLGSEIGWITKKFTKSVKVKLIAISATVRSKYTLTSVKKPKIYSGIFTVKYIKKTNSGTIRYNIYNNSNNEVGWVSQKLSNGTQLFQEIL